MGVSSRKSGIMFRKIVSKIMARQEAPATNPKSSFEALERLVGEMDGLSFSEVDEKLGVHTSNRNASGRGYMSPRFYRRRGVETEAEKKRRQERAAQVLSRKD